MAATTSAGSYAAAVLETAGYVTQSYMLETFREYFQYAGMFLFVCTCVGALLSVALFGSYKFIRYLIAGPAMFFLMTGTIGETKGAVWRIGDGTPRTLSGPAASESDAIDAVRETVSMDEMASRAAKTLRHDIPIAWPFQVYTRLVDGFTRSLINVIVDMGEDDYMLFLSRMKAYELLMESDLGDSELIQMFQGDFLAQCDVMFEASAALSSRLLDVDQIADYQTQATAYAGDARGSRAAQAETFATNNRDYHQQRYDTIAKSSRVTIGDPTRAWLRRNFSNPEVVAIIDNSQNKGRTVEEIGSFTCGEMWKILAEAIYQSASTVQDSVLRRAAPGITAAEKSGYTQQLCNALALKLGRSPGMTNNGTAGTASCDIVETAAVFLLRNALSKSGPSQTASRIKDQMQIIKTVKAGTPIPENEDWHDFEAIIQDGGYLSQEVRGGASNQYRGREYSFINKKTGKQEWRPAIVLQNDVVGDFDSAFVLHQSLQARELRQKIFTFALQMPYYQGMLLFLIAASFPFLSVILVVPGRAVNFINIPLAWLWVKSWDVGFAFVSLFEKVIWNMFPSTDFESGSHTQNALNKSELPTIMAEAFKMDPGYHVHVYYFFLSTALMAVPVVTGMLILRMRSSVFSAYTSAMSRSAQNAGGKAGEVYANNLNNDIGAPLESELKGAAILSQGPRAAGSAGSGGAESGSGGQVLQEAQELGNLKAAGGVISGALKKVPMSVNPISWADFGAEIAASAVELPGAQAAAAAEFDVQLRKRNQAFAAVNHPTGGINGDLRMMTIAGYFAAADGTGGWNHPDYTAALGAIKEHVATEKKKLEAAEGVIQGAFQASMGKASGVAFLNRLTAVPLGAVLLEEAQGVLLSSDGRANPEGAMAQIQAKVERALEDPKVRDEVVQMMKEVTENTMAALPGPLRADVKVIPSREETAPQLAGMPKYTDPAQIRPGKTAGTGRAREAEQRAKPTSGRK